MANQDKKKVPEPSTTKETYHHHEEGDIEELNPAARDMYRFWMNSFDIFSASLIKEINKILQGGLDGEKSKVNS